MARLSGAEIADLVNKGVTGEMLDKILAEPAPVPAPAPAPAPAADPNKDTQPEPPSIADIMGSLFDRADN